MLDSDLAELYGVQTRVLVQAVKRNIRRFPEDLILQLSKEELEQWRSQFVMSNPSLKMGLRRAPYAFTEHGAVMLASVLKSSIAIQASVQVVRAFIRLRELLATHKDLTHKLEALEKKYETHDVQIKNIFDAIRSLMEPGRIPPKRQIGFIPKEEEKR